MKETGAYTGLAEEESVEGRQAVEDLVGLEERYANEAQTVEDRR